MFLGESSTVSRWYPGIKIDDILLKYDHIWDIKEKRICVFAHLALLENLFGAQNRDLLGVVLTMPSPRCDIYNTDM